jgi:Xaa-Pro aminopeptidase
VSGRFSDRQKQVYQAVLNVKKKAEQLLRPGVFLNEYHKEVGHIMTDELLNLGLLDKTDVKNENPKWPAYKKYFMHGTSHYIGIDTHDVGPWNEPLKEGMVFTCEPGIYIREENLGIRLEDDLLVTSSNPKNLMANIPIEIEEIEALMNG